MTARELAPLAAVPLLVAAAVAAVWFIGAGVVAAIVAWPLLVPLGVAAAACAVGATGTPTGVPVTHREGQ